MQIVSDPPPATDLDEFRRQAAAFIQSAVADGVACPAYGAILSPALHEPAMAWQRYCFEQGWAGLHWPSEYGGQGLTRAHNTVWHEECARAEVAPYLNLQGIVLAGEAILRSGTDAQRDRLLRPTLTGEILWCQLFSEPGAGSDLAGLSSRADLDGDHFVLNGQKVWSSNAQFAQRGILMARTDPQVPRHRGISFFLLDMRLPGVEIRPVRQMTGDEEFCEVFFTDVEIPAEALLGDLHGGWRVAMEVLIDERGGAGGAGVISLGQRLDALVAGVAARGRTLDPTARGAVAHLVSRGRALQALMERSGGDPLTANVAKLYNSDLGYAEAALGSALHGADGMLSGPVTDRLLYSPGMRIAGGSSEIQRNIIGERTLGLPREPEPGS